MKYFYKIAIILLSINLLGCGKSLMEQFGFVETRIQGKWEIVNYSLNGVNLIDSKNFYFKKIEIDKTRINYQNILQAFPKNCAKCNDSIVFYVDVSYDVNNNADVNFSYYGENGYDSTLKAIPSTNQTINPFSFKQDSGLNSITNSWQIEKLSASVLKLKNQNYDWRVTADDITITFEKY